MRRATAEDSEGYGGFFVIFLLFRVLYEAWLYQLLLYHFRTSVCLCLCTFPNLSNIDTYYPKKSLCGMVNYVLIQVFLNTNQVNWALFIDLAPQLPKIAPLILCSGSATGWY